MNRRDFLQKTGALGVAASGLSFAYQDQPDPPLQPPEPEPANRGPYPTSRPNVILVRFGGGVRRRETIAEPDHTTYSPFIYHELHKNKGGILFKNMEIESQPGIVTNHGQGTLYLLTGKYDRYSDIDGGIGDRFEPKVPTIFEYFRRKYDVPTQQTLIVNGEDRINEEFYTFSNDHNFGVRYRSTVLSLYRFKTYLLRKKIADGAFVGSQLDQKQRELDGMRNRDYRIEDRNRVEIPEIDRFWEKWRSHYGDSGFVNPRGDRLLTTLSLWALRELKPKLMMINYQDPDYVHWGPRQFYTRAISIIDEGVRELYSATQADDAYRNRTVFIIVPDCGRDANRAMPVPYQHHSNSRSAHQIFAVIAGPSGIIGRAAVPVDRLQQQIFVARTIGQLMDFETPQANNQSLLT